MRGVITFVFDDGYEAVYQHVVPLLNKLKMPGVFALPLNTPSFQMTVDEPVRPWQDWLPIKTQGHEIAAHSASHTDLTLLTADKLLYELQEPQQALSASTLIYPGGACNDEVVRQAKKLYSAARTTVYGQETIPPADPWRLTTVDYTKDNFSIWRANSRALSAWLTGSWLIETYHLIDIADSSMHHSVLLQDFTKHLHFVKKLSISVKTINEVIRDSHN